MLCERQLVRGAALLIASCVTQFGNARAQAILQKAYGSAQFDEFGAAVAMGPDLDGDGFLEVAVGAPYVDKGWQEVGAVYVLSGRDFSRMQTLTGGTASKSHFGAALCWCGDLDGDGQSELAIGAPGPGYGFNGTVQIYSSSTWTQLRKLSGSSDDFGFGSALTDAGDVNGDAVDDLVVGAPCKLNSSYGVNSGAMYAYSGSDGSLLWSVDGSLFSHLGSSVAAVGDVDGDGHVDFAVGEPGAIAYGPWYAGVVEVYSGKDQSVLQRWSGNDYYYYVSYSNHWYLGDELGIVVGAAGDFDGDGVPDVWAASYQGVPKGNPYVSIFSGATGATLRTMVCGSSWQTSAATIGDVNGDGLPEFISIGLNSLSYGYQSSVSVFSSVDGRILWQIDDKSHDGHFTSVAGDPFSSADFLVGSGLDDSIARDAGKVELRATNDLWLDVAPTHFPVAGDTLTFAAAEGPTGNLAMLVLTSANGIPLFVPLTFTTFDASGSASLLTATIPPGFSGTSLTFRAFAIGATGRVVDSIDELITLQ